MFISFRVFAFPDITVDGSITLGACVTSVLLVTQPTPISQSLPWAIAAGIAAAAGCVLLAPRQGKKLKTLLIRSLVAAVLVAGFVVLVLGYRNPVAATIAGGAGKCVAGMTTGLLHAKFKIHGLLSGILVMTASTVNMAASARRATCRSSRRPPFRPMRNTSGNWLLNGQTLLHVFRLGSGGTRAVVTLDSLLSSRFCAPLFCMRSSAPTWEPPCGPQEIVHR